MLLFVEEKLRFSTEKIFHFLPQTCPTLAVMADRLQQQVDEYPQLLCLATCQETQDNGGPGGCARLPLKLTARFTAQTAEQDPVSQTANTALVKNQCLLLVVKLWYSINWEDRKIIKMASCSFCGQGN